MNFGICLLIQLFVQSSYSEPDTHVHIYIPPEQPGGKVVFVEKITLGIHSIMLHIHSITLFFSIRPFLFNHLVFPFNHPVFSINRMVPIKLLIILRFNSIMLYLPFNHLIYLQGTAPIAMGGRFNQEPLQRSEVGSDYQHEPNSEESTNGSDLDSIICPCIKKNS